MQRPLLFVQRMVRLRFAVCAFNERPIDMPIEHLRALREERQEAVTRQINGE